MMLRLFQRLKGSKRTFIRPAVVEQNKRHYKSNEKESSANFQNLFYICATSIAGYHIYKERFLPSVSAATPITNSLSGRRQQFNFIADVVNVSASSLVFIEINGEFIYFS